MAENRLISNMNNLCANSYFWKGLIFGGANYRKEINVSKLAGLIIGGKFVLKFLNVRLVILEVLGQDSSQVNHSENAKSKHNGDKLY